MSSPLHKEPKIFKMVRDFKVVAYGVIFPNGKCCVAWEGIFRSIVVWDCIDDMKEINGHSDTSFIFI